ncbi:MAG TPA: hypothetical protein GX014_07725 [Firmicutes bacterium]|nr:hypothetical protein [Bacillota bacterium]HHT43272.1 hypothetical protein [Bacillota bacterium]
MIVNSKRALALVCPACQRLETHEFSVFEVSRRPLRLVCSCGFFQGNLARSHSCYELDVFSVIGQREHVRVPRRTFFSTPLMTLFSSHSGHHLGYLGNPEDVTSLVAETSPVFLPSADDFANPEIMGQILQQLQDLAEKQKIRCDCEHSSVGLDVYADRVELVCSFCGSVIQIDASTPKHQERLSRVTEIIMEPCTSQMLGEWLKPLN